MSEVNEDNTTGDFREMGRRLAQEVVSFIKKKVDKVSRSGDLTSIKLSFVGHSIGNVIIRTALAGIYIYVNCYVFLSNHDYYRVKTYYLINCRAHYGAVP